MRDKSKLFALVAVVLSTAAFGLAVTAGHSGRASAGPPCPAAAGRAGKLRACLSKSLVFIETPLATGSGLLLPDGHVITNAHVIDPFAAADIELDGGKKFRKVEVVGIDAFADIAVLGPVDTGNPGIGIAPLPQSDIGEADVFLVGYPGEVDTDSPHVAISSGVLSRMRTDTAFDMSYLQTDAAIAGGQSGGVLVDGDGRVLGISGSSFAGTFALALTADDVIAAEDRILAGEGDQRHTVPLIDSAKSDPVTVSLTADMTDELVLLPAADKERTIHLSLGTDDDVGMSVGTFLGDPIGMNAAARDLVSESFGDVSNFPDVNGFDPFEGIDELVPDSSGRYDFTAPKDQDVLVYLQRVDDVDLTIDADVPFEAVPTVSAGKEATVGARVRGVLDGLVTTAVHPIELTKGDQIDIVVHAGTSDAFFTLLAPDATYDPLDVPSAEDGGGGLNGLDPKQTFDIDQTGTWQIVVSTYDALTTGYILDVRRHQ